MWLHWRVLQAVSFFYLISTGLYALRFDRKLRQFRNSWLLQFYAIGHNVLVLVLIPIDFIENLNFYFDNSDMFPSMLYIHLVIIFLRSISTALTLLTRWHHEQQLWDNIAELSRLEAKFNFDDPRSPSMKALFYAKMIIISCLITYHFIYICALFLYRLIFTIEAARLVMNLIFLLNMTGLHYFVFLWHICNILVQLNNKLLVIRQQVAYITKLRLSESGKLQMQLAADLCELSATHAQVAKLLMHLNATFKYKLLATFAFYFVTFVSFCNFLLLLITGYGPMDFLNWIINAILFGCGFLDFLLFIILSDRLTSYTAEVVSILQQFEVFSSKDMLLVNRSTELVTYQLLTCNFEVNVLGLFAMNRQTVFTIASSGLLYIIFFMQTDYERKFNEPLI